MSNNYSTLKIYKGTLTSTNWTAIFARTTLCNLLDKTFTQEWRGIHILWFLLITAFKKLNYAISQQYHNPVTGVCYIQPCSDRFSCSFWEYIFESMASRPHNGYKLNIASCTSSKLLYINVLLSRSVTKWYQITFFIDAYVHYLQPNPI